MDSEADRVLYVTVLGGFMDSEADRVLYVTV